MSTRTAVAMNGATTSTSAQTNGQRGARAGRRSSFCAAGSDAAVIVVTGLPVRLARRGRGDRRGTVRRLPLGAVSGDGSGGVGGSGPGEHGVVLRAEQDLVQLGEAPVDRAAELDGA